MMKLLTNNISVYPVTKTKVSVENFDNNNLCIKVKSTI